MKKLCITLALTSVMFVSSHAEEIKQPEEQVKDNQEDVALFKVGPNASSEAVKHCMKNLAESGNFELVVKLTFHKNISAPAINVGMVYAAAAGHLNIVIFLKNNDLLAYHALKAALVEAAFFGHEKVVDYLLENQLFNAHDVYYAATMAGNRGHRELALFLNEIYEIAVKAEKKIQRKIEVKKLKEEFEHLEI